MKWKLFFQIIILIIIISMIGSVIYIFMFETCYPKYVFFHTTDTKNNKIHYFRGNKVTGEQEINIDKNLWIVGHRDIDE